MPELILNRRNGDQHLVLYDEADTTLLADHHWYIWQSTLQPTLYYAVANIRVEGRRTTKKMHSLITGLRDVDHVNRNGLDNRRQNLRPATRSQQGANTPSRGGTSQYRGVYWDRTRNSWLVRININQKHRFIGRFSSEEEAAKAYDEVALATWGEFATLNLPHESRGGSI